MTEFFERLRKEKGRSLISAWVIEGPYAGSKALFAEEPDGLVFLYAEDSFPGYREGKLRAEELRIPEGKGYARTASEGQTVFLERITGKTGLVICGAGHVSIPIIRIGILLGYEVTVIEDREEFAARARDAGAHHVITERFDKALNDRKGGPEDACVVVTRGHSHDVECLKCILKKKYAYAGLMGSHSRTAMIREQLIAEGFDAEKVNRVHMPIGLPIGSRTPEEIAVSILAEVIQTMNRKIPGEGFPENLLSECCRIAQEDGDVRGVLAVITDKKEEAPRQPGTKMLVRKDGSFAGSVGGGFAEAEILREARAMLSENRRACALRKVTMKKGSMQCGGEIEVFLMPL